MFSFILGLIRDSWEGYYVTLLVIEMVIEFAFVACVIVGINDKKCDVPNKKTTVQEKHESEKVGAAEHRCVTAKSRDFRYHAMFQTKNPYVEGSLRYDAWEKYNKAS